MTSWLVRLAIAIACGAVIACGASHEHSPSGVSPSGRGGQANASGASGTANGGDTSGPADAGGASETAGAGGSETAAAGGGTARGGSPAGGKSGLAGMGTSGTAGTTSLTSCEHPSEREQGSGFILCDNGVVHRPTAGSCRAYEPTSTAQPASDSPDEDECTTDADCTVRAYGYCLHTLRLYSAPVVPNHCVYGCTVDAECDGGQICVCGATRGDCHAATCTLDADCGKAGFCAEYRASCGIASGFSCQTPSDACEVDADCSSSLACVGRKDGTRTCGLPYCAA